MINLPVSLGAKFNHEATSELTFSLREAAHKCLLVAHEASLGDFTGFFGTLARSLKSTELFQDFLVASLASEAYLEAHAVGLYQLCRKLRDR